MRDEVLELERARKGRQRRVSVFLWTLFAGAMVASAGVAVFPGLLHYTEPVICDADGEKLEVVLSVSHPEPGKTVWTADLFCVGAEGRPREASYLAAAVTVGLVSSGALLGVLGLVWLVGQLRGPRAGAMALLVMLAVALSGCQWGTISPEQFEARYGVSPGQVTAAEARPNERLLFSVAELQGLLDELKELKGDRPLRLARLTVHHSRATVLMEKPGSESELFEYEYRRGDLSGPTSQVHRGEAFFEAQELSLDKLPFLWGDAGTRLGYVAPELSHFVVERTVDDDRVVVRVYVNDGAESGFDEYDGRGGFVRVGG